MAHPTSDPRDVLSRLSLIHPYGEHGSECGYCHSKEEGRVSYGARAKRLTCADYQALCDHGWRRSGDYIYKPTNDRTCCPNLTIRLDVTQFQASKAQNQLLRRLNKLLLLSGEADGGYNAERGDAKGGAGKGEGDAHMREEGPPDETRVALLEVVRLAAASAYPLVEASALASITVTHLKPAQRAVAPIIDGHSVSYSSNVAFIIAAVLKRASGVVPQRKRKVETTTQAQGVATAADTETNAQSSGSSNCAALPSVIPLPFEIASAIAEKAQALAADYQLAALQGALFAAAGPGNVNVALPSIPAGETANVPVHSPAAAEKPGTNKRVKTDASQVSCSEGADASSAPAPAASTPPVHTWRVETVPAAFEEEAWRLYVKYQTTVHGDSPEECDKQQYTRFLCTSPLLREPYGAPTGQAILTPAAVPSSSSSSSSSAAALWSTPVGTVMQRCAGGLEAAWRDGEDGGKGLQLTACEAVNEAKPLAAGPSASAYLSSPLSSTPAPFPYAGFKPSPDVICPDMPGGAQWQGSSNASSNPSGPIPTSAGSGSGAMGGVSSSSSSAASNTSASSSSAASNPSASSATRTFSAGGADDLLRHGYGAFHHRYYLDGSLIAVGVVDVLPHSLSSVYVFYDPDVSGTKPSSTDVSASGSGSSKRKGAKAAGTSTSSAFPSSSSSSSRPAAFHIELGKLTALREIQWVQDAMRVSPRLRYYCMGFYVHQCPKMRYKGDYHPSDLLCPVTRRWVPLSSAVPKLDANKYAQLAADNDGADGSEAARQQRLRLEKAQVAALLPKVPVALGRDLDPSSLILLGQLNERGRKIVSSALLELLQRTGPELGGRIVAFLQ